MALSRTGATRALDGALGHAAPSAPPSGQNFMWLALLTAAASSNALGTEYAKTGYARQGGTGFWGSATAADPPVMSNANLLTYGPLTGADGTTITSAALMDAVSGGTAANMWAYWTLTTPRSPQAGDSAQVAAGALTHNVADT